MESDDRESERKKQAQEFPGAPRGGRKVKSKRERLDPQFREKKRK